MNTGKTIAWPVWTFVDIVMSLLFNTLCRFVIPGEVKGYPLQCSGLENPWTARTSNQSILKETDPEYSLEGLMLKLKLQYFGYLMRRADSLEKTLML